LRLGSLNTNMGTGDANEGDDQEDWKLEQYDAGI
jgi:hypothetical protein